MNKRQDVEIIRIICAFGIVWYHSQVPSGHYISYAALMIFIIMSGYFSDPTRLLTSPLASIQRRAARLLLPWLFWYAFYCLLNGLRGRPVIPSAYGIGALLLAGPSIHLWFVPFIFLGLLMMDAMSLFFPKRAFAAGCAVIAAALMLTSPFWHPGLSSLGEPAAQYVHATAALCIGVAYRGLIGMKISSVIAIVLVLLVASISSISVEGVGIPYGIAVLVGLWMPLGENFRLRSISISPLAGAMFGVYFCHAAVLNAVRRIPHGPEEGIPIMAFLISTAIIYTLRRFSPPLARYTS